MADQNTPRSLGVRWKQFQKDEIVEAAKLADLKPTDIIRMGALRLAREIKEKRTITLHTTPNERTP